MTSYPPITATVTMGCPPEVVWELLSDPTRMPEFSPELRKAIVVGRLGVGANIIGINRRKAVVWPTTSRIVRWEPGRVVAWKTRESGATWSYELEAAPEGTRVTGRRVMPRRSVLTKLVGPLLGSADGHDRELADALRTTLERVKVVVEG